MILTIGRVCKKISGVEAGSYCVVVDKVGKDVIIDGKNVKRGKCCIKHLFPLPVVLEITKNQDKETIVKLMEDKGLI